MSRIPSRNDNYIQLHVPVSSLANAAVVVVILKTAGQASLSLTNPALTLASDAVFSQRVVGPIQLFRQQVSVNH